MELAALEDEEEQDAENADEIREAGQRERIWRRS
jgi:hypothetical protein